jgi:hypothetical protein
VSIEEVPASALGPWGFATEPDQPAGPPPAKHVPFRPAHPCVLGTCPWPRFPVMERVVVIPGGCVIRTRIEWMGLN